MRFIHPTAIIYEGVTIEKDVYIGPYCIIGAPAENRKKENIPGKGVIIKSGTKIMGNATIDAGSDQPTIIGTNNYIMKSVHIGHDTITGNNVQIAPHVVIGGYVEMGDNIKIGMNTTIINRKMIPNNVIIGMGAVIIKKTELWSNATFGGNPAVKLD